MGTSFLFLLLVRTAGSAEVPELKPACKAETRGFLWPAIANGHARIAIQLSHEGQLEICTHGPWRYHWEKPTVHVTLLKQKPAR